MTKAESITKPMFDKPIHALQSMSKPATRKHMTKPMFDKPLHALRSETHITRTAKALS